MAAWCARKAEDLAAREQGFSSAEQYRERLAEYVVNRSLSEPHEHTPSGVPWQEVGRGEAGTIFSWERGY